MSGHSKWSTIKRQKEVNDQARGKLFSKLSKGISIAIKSGGGTDPDMNHKLRMAIDQAKTANMPKTNIDRAIKRAQETGDIEEMTYEGYGPGNVAVIVEVATDNRNRAAQEIKSIFDRVGGRLVVPGAVSFIFESKGYLAVQTEKADEQMMAIIDLEVDDVEENGGVIDVYTSPTKTHEIKESIESLGYKVLSAELIKKPTSYQAVSSDNEMRKIVDFLNKLEDHDDVQKVFFNVEIPEDMI